MPGSLPDYPGQIESAQTPQYNGAMSSAATATVRGIAPTGRPIAVSNWLLAVTALVVLMVVVGGITRLTESGLSITEWKPVTGAIPPLDTAEWQAEFDKYKQIPEYLEINGPAGMTLAEFKHIYFWEWAHRLLGRLIGLAFAVPLLWFALTRAIPHGYGKRLSAILALGALQGAIGWWMVTSGLTERTDVSHFRLAVHLLTALVILGALLWTALDLRRLQRDNSPPARLTGFGMLVFVILFVQLLFGAYTAGLNAGHVSDTWPLMHGALLPAGIDGSAGLWHRLNNDPYLIHFMHRWWAWVAVVVLVVLARRIRQHNRVAAITIHMAYGTQILLGIATVMTNVNIVLAVSHQGVGALLVAATVWGVHVLGERER